MRLETDRLTIRSWQQRDLPAFAEINADPEVRRYYYPAILTSSQSDAVVEQCMQHLKTHGFAFLAVERWRDKTLIGGAGLTWTNDVPDGPAVEIGWILGRAFWRQGYAREASLAWFKHGWSIGLDEIVGYTSEINQPSRNLMRSLGMSRDPADDFPDPTVPEGNPLRPHVLFRAINPARS
ncbi:MAG: GNAT family N-acetyltransferase [Parvibaculum sp.]|uniref:GNAT family N-acetyltransferase n=1 Tax=Parvibaculum sp. TaxID=2024848 RepID=UPI002ABB1BA2|nr:GNAT family N-acetyltransferase [Parvibaculum sp.]MDZ4381407.1 GNAT family N-acetyltransferase [Parvibaculum sp.]